MAYGKTVRIADEQPKTKSSTLPRSSIRIRPILKNRIENIYTDLITSAAVSGRPTTYNKNISQMNKIGYKIRVIGLFKLYFTSLTRLLSLTSSRLNPAFS
jgi:hypothetical protein